jgi:antirestriction protein ArdC
MNRVVEHRPRHKPCSRRCDSTRWPIRDRRIQSPSSVESKGSSCVCRTQAQAPNDGADAMSFDIYAEVTSKIVSMLEAGVVPWRCPILGKGQAGWPQNLESRKPYRGVNVFLLSFTAWTKGYLPKLDTVHIPEPTRFATTSDYYSTLFHELAHSTGHSSRLDRGLDTNPAPFGSPDYGREELVAEMAAAFLCGHAGIVPATIENHAAYVGGWIKTLKGDKKLAIAAAGAAQKAADWVTGIRSSVEHIRA